jgi:hypothetical protein
MLSISLHVEEGALTNWQLAMFLWPLVILAFTAMALMAFWPQVLDRAGRVRRAAASLLRGQGARNGESNHS